MTPFHVEIRRPDGPPLVTVRRGVARLLSRVGRELFTSADNYVLSIAESVPRIDPLRPLILGAVMCIDMVLKE